MERTIDELMETYRVAGPPVPIEAMLQNPLENMWDEVDISLVSGSFMAMGDPYVPRMSFARVLARHLVNSAWGAERGLSTYKDDPRSISTLARVIIMPRSMLERLAPSARNAHTLSGHFEAPFKDAALRLEEIATYGSPS
jgi:hypothetical protein